jgi:hypothetical protein
MLVRRLFDCEKMPDINEPGAIQPTGNAVEQPKVGKDFGIVLIKHQQHRSTSRLPRVSLLAPLRPPKND